MTLRDRQDRFIELLSGFDSWPDRFNFFIESGNVLPPTCPLHLVPYKIGTCRSETCFKAENSGGIITVDGWSNSTVMAGIIALVKEIVDGVPVASLGCTPVDFHTVSGLADNLTPLRQAALQEIINRVTVLCDGRLLKDL